MSNHILQYQFTEYGLPDKVGKLVSVPRPTLRSDSDVLIKVHAAAVNPADALYIAGIYYFKPDSFPAAGGFEGAGVVAEAGKTSGYKPGQRVHFYASKAAGWAEYIVLDTKEELAPVVLPESISFEEGAQLTINPITAIGMLLDLGIQKGDYLLQTAASSALGRIIIQLAKFKGIKTINVVRRDEHKKGLFDIGADYVINSEKEDLVAAVKKIAPEGVKFALDAVAGKVGSDVVLSLAKGGKVLVYGLLSGEPIQIQAPTLIFNLPIVTGFWLLPFMRADPARAEAAYKETLDLVSSKKLSLHFLSFDAKTHFNDAIVDARTPGKEKKTILLFH